MSQTLKDLELKRTAAKAAYDTALAAHEAALATIAADQANYDAAKQAYDRAIENGGNADAIAVTRATLQAAQTALELAKSRTF
jgi:hypothetical protein